jgi:hypothetical protein
MPNNYELLLMAIKNRQQVKGCYDGYYREMCPHAMGWKNGSHHVLSFQFAGESSRILPPGGQWKCMDIDGINIVSVSDGQWFTDSRHSRPQTCIDQIEVEVSY